MPYIGQRPSKGDENNFKILDDISSYTLTFDGSDSSVVSAANDTITSLTHRFVQGQRVTYNNGGGSNIAGLTSGTVYFIIKEDHNTIKLATTASNASNGVVVNLTGVGGGSSHTLNVAFDGVNTKFKATHTNGQKARITRSAQLVISINGVIQQPHDTATPSTGFGFDLDGTIVLSQAPVAGDIYWAHVLTNNNVTFDISDNDIDNFTGDGSTTNFTMSKTPPDPRNVLVTNNGVVQYPNDTTTTRDYSVATDSNVLSFTTAPGNGVKIQVRHIGFAGGAGGGSGLVQSVFGRTGDVVLTNADDITVRNIVGTGATFSGNVSIGGTLTYQDVTNIDSVGIVTARSGLKVLAGGANIVGVVSATQGAVITGIVTATSYRGDGSQLTGVVSGITIKEEGSALSTQATTLNFVGANITASGGGAEKTITVIAGAGGTFAANAVGVHTTKILGINTTTVAGSATSEGAIQVRGNIAIEEGLLTLDSNINTSVSVPSGKNAMLIGPTTVGAAATIDVAQGSTLVVV